MRHIAFIALACAALAACNRGGGDEEQQAAAGECPALTAQQFADRGLDLGSGSSINGIGTRRERGSSSCRVQGDGVACELTDPGVVGVTPAEGAAASYFDVPQGRNATITVSGGEARCTLS